MGVPVVITDMSTTAASNSPAGSDSIGTSLDDYIRSHAAFIAQLFSTISLYAGTVGGTANAITLTPSPALTAYATGQRVVFKATGNSSGNVTLAVSGLSAKNVYQGDGTTQLGSGDIASGKYYTLVYDSSLNSSAGGFMYDSSGSFLTSAAATAVYAPLASPTFTGAPALPTGTTAVTQSASNNTTKLATTAYADAQAALRLLTVKRQVFTANGTYTPSSGMAYCDVEVQGAGTTGSGGNPGAGGGYVRGIVSAATVGGSQTITVGTTSGTNSSFGAIMTGNGASGITGGGASGGDWAVAGGSASNSGGNCAGGSSQLGRGGYNSTGGAGGGGTGYGAGGGGGTSSGAFSPGIVIVTEYCKQ